MSPSSTLTIRAKSQDCSCSAAKVTVELESTKNTDLEFSQGYYCSINKINMKENLYSNFLKLLNKEYKERLHDQNI